MMYYTSLGLARMLTLLAIVVDAAFMGSKTIQLHAHTVPICATTASITMTITPSKRGLDILSRNHGDAKNMNIFTPITNMNMNTNTARLAVRDNDNDNDSVTNSPYVNVGHDLLPAADAGPISSVLTEGQIHYLIERRIHCKKIRNYSQADAILDGLNRGGVYVHDKRKEWRADGSNHFGRTSKRHAPYVRRGGCYQLTEDDLITVSAMIEKRAQAKLKREYHISDGLKDTLRSKYNVKLNDKKREWSVVIKDHGGNSDSNTSDGNGFHMYVPSPLAPPDHPTHTMNDDSKALIQKRLTDREVARKLKDYRTADLIRDEMMDDYSIVIDDLTREWKVVTSDDDSDEFVREAQDSQRSAFVREHQSSKVADKDMGEDFQATSFGDDNVDIHISEDFPLIEDDAAVVASAVPEVSKEEEESNLANLTMSVLKEKLRKAGLPVSGRKAELIDRLMKAPME